MNGRGRKPKPTAIRRAEGNPGKRGFNPDEPVPPDGIPECPAHLCEVARAEWDRLAGALHGMGVLTLADRAAFAAYCQAWVHWVEAEERRRETPPLVRTPSGYVQQSPWIGIANKQLELMGRYMTELGLTPAARRRISVGSGPQMTVSTEPLVFGAIIDHVARHGRRIGEPPQTEAERQAAIEEWQAKHGVTDTTKPQ